MKRLRPPAVAGSFYPSEPKELRAQIAGYLSRRSPRAKKPPRFLIVPHAGYVYSGQVAASAFAEVQGAAFERVLLLGPSHRFYFDGAAATLDSAWQTPLGDVAVTRPSGWGLIESSYHAPEHSLEVQVPFIQAVLPQAKLMPLLLSGSQEQAPELAEQLLPLVDASTLVVVSSDFNHVGPSFRFDPSAAGYADGEAMDQAALDWIKQGDQQGFARYLKRTGATICGALPILTAMEMARRLGFGPFVFQEYACSAQISPGPNSVGYASLYA